MASLPFPNAAARALFEKLTAEDCAEHFKVLPDPVLFPDYYYFIRHPVALSDMGRSLTTGRYTLADMQRDIRRMIANAKKYNKPEAVVYQDSLELEVRSRLRARRATGQSKSHCPLPPCSRPLILPPLPSRLCTCCSA